MAKNDNNGGEWVNEPFYFEQAVEGTKKSVKACITTSPDGKKFISIREWGEKANGEAYFTRNGMSIPFEEPVASSTRDAFIAALQAVIKVKSQGKIKKPSKRAPDEEESEEEEMYVLTDGVQFVADPKKTDRKFTKFRTKALEFGGDDLPGAEKHLKKLKLGTFAAKLM